MTRAHLVAHRGYPGRYPDNSMAGIRAVLGAGARFLEVDVQLSADGTPYLFHDETLERVCGRPGRFVDLGDGEVAALRASETARLGEAFANEPVARFEGVAGVLRGQPGVFTFVELKPAATEAFGAATVVDAILAHLSGLEQRVALISFDLNALEATRARGHLPLGPILRNWHELESEDLERLAPEYVFCDTRRLPQGSLTPLSRHPEARLAVYEVIEAELARELFGRGAHFVETFEYPELSAALAADAEGER